MKESTTSSIENNQRLTGERKVYSLRGPALFPEYYTSLSKNILSTLFFDRCKLAEKDSGEYMYGSPFHGEQKLLYKGRSEIYMLTEMSKIEKPSWSTEVRDITTLLESGGSVLFTPEDVQAAKLLDILTYASGGILTLAKNVVAKDQLNGIILVPKADKSIKR